MINISVASPNTGNFLTASCFSIVKDKFAKDGCWKAFLSNHRLGGERIWQWKRRILAFHSETEREKKTIYRWCIQGDTFARYLEWKYLYYVIRKKQFAYSGSYLLKLNSSHFLKLIRFLKSHFYELHPEPFFYEHPAIP